MELEVFSARFIKEGQNRFISYVELKDEIIECYIPSSAKLSNFIKLNGKDVLITKNKSINKRTKYSLFAVKYYNKYILLNLNLINKLMKNYLAKIDSNSVFYLEKNYKGYKSDILCETTNGKKTIIEIKGIIDVHRTCVFPSKSSDRAIEQLLKLQNILLLKNINVEYYLVSLGPIVKKISIQETDSEYVHLLRSCLSNGMKLNAVSIEYTGSDYLYKKIPVEFDF